MLFGGSWRDGRWIYRIRRGDIGFLYNYDTEKLYGTFRAVSDGSTNIEKDAWGGRFPCQVKVEIYKPYKPVSRELLERSRVVKKLKVMGRWKTIMKYEDFVEVNGLFRKARI